MNYIYTGIFLFQIGKKKFVSGLGENPMYYLYDINFSLR